MENEEEGKACEQYAKVLADHFAQKAERGKKAYN